MVLEQKIYDIKSSFLEAILRYQNNSALILENKIITYKELYLKSLSLNNAIYKQKPNCSILGIMAQRNEAAFVSVAASVIGEITYVPLNSRFPDERLKQIILNSGLEIIVVDAQNIDKAERIIKSTGMIINIIPYETVQINDKNINIINNNYLEYCKNKICYLLFTSGSTGTPKGVPINNTNLCSFLNHANKYFKVYEEDILSQTFDLSFDLSVFDIFMSWLNGASLCLMNPFDLLNPIDYILRNKITIWFSVPALVTNIRALGKYNDILYSLRLSLFCGEALNQKDVLFWETECEAFYRNNL
jgi:acyl-coenzyme A synthetase/AMP-(fatty) acid ligase